MARKVARIVELDEKIGSMIRELRIASGMSRNELAQHIEVTHQQLKKYEDGSNRISAGRLYYLARAFNKRVSYFFDENTQQESNDLPSDKQRMCIELARNFMRIEDGIFKEAINDLVRNLSKVSNN